MPSLAAVVITKNEEGNIGACLASLRWVQNIIVVDACSTDRTVEIAREYTPHVLSGHGRGSGPRKITGFYRADADWIFIVDADERVTDDWRVAITQA